jgi:predicted phosphodiesterase
LTGDIVKIAVLSDIHANEPALGAVLQDTLDRGFEHFWCLGDMVGYYSDPVEPLMFIKRYVDPDDWVMGNHEAMLADLILPQDLPLDADKVIEINTKMGILSVRGTFLSPEQWESTNATPVTCLKLNRDTLDANNEATQFWRSSCVPARMEPRLKTLNGRGYILVHASQVDHVGRYVYSWQHEFLLPKEFQLLDEQRRQSGNAQVLWFGHTHVPTLVNAHPAESGTLEFEPVFIEPNHAYALDSELVIVNPGSVGQPRDSDRRASYAVLDTDAHTVTFIRVDYNWRETAQRLLAKGYPESLARKLRDAPPDKTTPDLWKKYYEEMARMKL